VSGRRFDQSQRDRYSLARPPNTTMFRKCHRRASDRVIGELLGVHETMKLSPVTRCVFSRSGLEFARLVALISLAALHSGAAAAQVVAKRGPEAIDTIFPIDDQDPESTIPSAHDAIRNPLQMGYLMMALSDRADAALQAGRPAAAAKYYRAMGKAVPERAVAFRKACSAHEAAGERAKAVETCRDALGKGGVTAADHVRFVQVMLKKDGALSKTDVEDIEAVLGRLAGELALGAEEAGRLQLADLRCQLAARLEDSLRLSACTEELRTLKVAPAKVIAYSWALALSTRDTAAAKAVIDDARRAGLPNAAIESMESGLSRAGLAGTRGVSARFWLGAIALAAALVLIAAATLRARRRSRLEPA
jgi:hypothetical protein